MTEGDAKEDMATSQGRLVRVAAIGITVLALPGLFGAWMAYEDIALQWPTAMRDADQLLDLIGVISFYVVLIGGGYLLLCGYWMVYLDRLKPPMRGPFWWVSVGYNGLLTTYIWWMALTLAHQAIRADDLSAEYIATFLIFEIPSLALACWTAFMLWLSIRQASG